ncbi:hypothetical protein K443DRAFT_256228 [Laccaria amethystina LaAM-08-1]|jgi:hypothetical protein|uniref:Uncharacterized protein n=1 Tax=Laccaria amethystina LaAM-08-1 TaxID=1095629 RepID=A0A0C9XHZ9_9AGAR|nr:hypothetical protein K443DRAFT_256228 [Laccaria amethystina LaAM-08-1]
MLAAGRRQGDIRCLVLLLVYHLRLCRLILTYKLRTSMASKPCLRAQALVLLADQLPSKAKRNMTQSTTCPVTRAIAQYQLPQRSHGTCDTASGSSTPPDCSWCIPFLCFPVSPYNCWPSFKPRNHCRFVCTYHFTSIRRTRSPQWDFISESLRFWTRCSRTARVNANTDWHPKWEP